ncbi:hypothetical protein VTO73DRAFT_5901 [Trametes versicolor]
MRRPQSASSAYAPPMSASPRPTSPVSSSAPVARSNRVSSIQQQDSESVRRQSRLPELLTRKRTASMPHRKDRDGQPDPFTAHPTGSSSFVTYESTTSPSAPSVHSMSTTSPSSPQPSPLTGLPKRARGSMLLTSGISLPFSRSRSKFKKSRLPPPPTSFLFSEVIEISAPPPPPPEEDEDRERLRDAAAQSIGLDPVLLEERAVGAVQVAVALTVKVAFVVTSSNARPRRFTSRCRDALGKYIGAVPGHTNRPQTLGATIFESGEASSSVFVAPLCTLQAMEVANIGSHVFTVGGFGPAYADDFFFHVAHLHVFKSASGDDKELERVEIGADSVVFVNEEEIGGRRGVVKVGGVGGVEMTLSMVDQNEAHNWITAIKQAVLSERSVRAGLGAVTHSNGVEPRGDIDVMLSMRAQGLFNAPTPIVTSGTTSTVQSYSSATSPTATASPTPSLRSASPQHNRPPSVAVSALRGLFGGNRPRSPSGATLDTSFSSISEHGSGAETPPLEDASFGRAGTSLLGMLRSNSISSERPMSPTTPMSSSPTTPRVGSTAPADLPIQMGLITPTSPVPTLDQKILQDKDRENLLPSISRNGISGLGLTGVNGHANGAVLRFNGSSGLPPFGGSPSLHPPPRRRAWTASGPPPTSRMSSERNGFSYTHGNASAAETLGVRHNGSAFLSPTASSPASASASPSPASPSSTSSPKLTPSPSLSPSTTASANGVGSPGSHRASQDGRPRSSWSSVSSLGSNEQPQQHVPRTSFDFGPKRWSRQAMLPKRSTPPSGPPPATPPSAPTPLPSGHPAKSLAIAALGAQSAEHHVQLSELLKAGFGLVGAQ